MKMSLTKESTSGSPSTNWLLIIRDEYSSALAATVRSNAAWFFGGLALAAVSVLLLEGRTDVLRSAFPYLVGMPIMIALTLLLTSGVKKLDPIETRCTKTQLSWQVVLLLIIIAFDAYRSIIFYFPNTFQIPGVYDLARLSIYFLGPKPVAPGHMYSAPKPPGHLIAIPVIEFLIPLPLLLLLGARWRELGLGRGYFSWRVILTWSIAPILGLIAVTYLGIDTGIIMFLQHTGRAVLQTGFPTDFLFRGALLTRLSYLIREDWGLVLSMLIFGFSFLGYQTNEVYGNWLVGAASTILIQAMLGLALGMILQRTGNLLASSIFYTLFELFLAFT